jgi:hypothetical protein
MFIENRTEPDSVFHFILWSKSYNKLMNSLFDPFGGLMAERATFLNLVMIFIKATFWVVSLLATEGSGL